MNPYTRNKWLEKYKDRLKLPGSTQPYVPDFSLIRPMTYTKKYSEENTRALRNPYGFFEAPAPGKFSFPYTRTPRPLFLGQDAEGSTTLTASWSLIPKLIFIGVVTAVVTDFIMRAIWTKKN